MPPNPIDFEKLLHFFQNLYAHALTLQEMFEHSDEIDDQTYDRLKPQYDRIASEKFDMFYRALNDPEGFARVVRDFLNIESKKGPVQ